jgi:putative ABC transport system permease protein
MELPLEIRPILSAMWRNKTGACLIALQIAVTLSVVVNALFIINQRVEKISQPVGTDTANIFSMSTVALSEDLNVEDFIREDLRLIRSIPGVRGATPVMHYLHGSSARADSYRAGAEVNDDREILTNINYTDEHGLEAMGVELLEGRFFRKDEIRHIDINFNGVPSKVIVTESLGRKFYPEGQLAGRMIYYDEDAQTMEIIGVISDVATPWLSRDTAFFADIKYNLMLQPYVIYEGRAKYLIRSEDGMLSSIIPEVERQLSERDPNRLIQRTLTQTEILERSFANDYATMVILLVVMFLMLAITALGIVGLAAFTVKQRTRQIGTRRALGARKRDILRYFLVENLLLTTMGVTLGVILTYVLSYVLSTKFGGERLDVHYFPAGVLILYVLGLIAVVGPAGKASSIPPAIATRSV